MVAVLTREQATARVQAWFAAQIGPDLLMSEWTLTELAAALSVKRRMEAVNENENEYTKAQAYFDVLAQHSIRVAQVTTRHFKLAAQKAGQHKTGLRAGDALHLAVCAVENACLCTLDKRLAAAGPPLNVTTLLL